MFCHGNKKKSIINSFILLIKYLKCHDQVLEIQLPHTLRKYQETAAHTQQREHLQNASIMIIIPQQKDNTNIFNS